MSISVKFKKYRLLDGSRKRLVQQVGDGSIIKRFDRTPMPKKPTDVVCPHFLELKWAYGCPFDCAWCYLKGTLRRLPTKTRPRIKDYDKIRRHVETFFDNARQPEILNSGELADSLMWENNGGSFSKFIIPLFESSSSHKILFLTKSNFTDNLLSIKHNGSPVVSFTLNAFEVSKRWEKGAPEPKKRVEAAKQLSDAGYEIRLRIDPMVPIENWETHYKNLVNFIFSKIAPERITIGSLRGLQSTIGQCRDRTWTAYLSETSNWGKKIDFGLRYKMYSMMADYLKEEHNFRNVAFCKETVGMWEKLGMNHRRIRCNCTW